MTIQKERNGAAKNGSKSWDNKTRFVVYGQVFLFFVAWMMALGKLVMNRFWNAKFNVEEIEVLISTEKNPKGYGPLCKKIRPVIFHQTVRDVFPTYCGSNSLVESLFLAIDPVDSSKIPKIPSHPGTGIDGLCHSANNLWCWPGIHGKFFNNQARFLFTGHFSGLLCLQRVVFCSHWKRYPQAQILVNAIGWIPTNNSAPARLYGPVNHFPTYWLAWAVSSLWSNWHGNHRQNFRRFLHFLYDPGDDVYGVVPCILLWVDWITKEWKSGHKVNWSGAKRMISLCIELSFYWFIRPFIL